jgi:uncharacterized protein YndB with AHSA1/START domain
MDKPKDDPETRQHEHTLEIDASPQAVWKAITDAAELVNWFPLDAEAKPGEGGHLTYCWGDAFKGTCRIEAWDPPRHLRTSWMATDAPGHERGAQLVVDWHVEGERGRTRLRLVHSGFGPGHDWDEEYDGTNRGWEYELRSLKHYLERHPGRQRSAFWLRKATGLEVTEIWKRMLGPQGLVQWTASAPPPAGSPVRLSLSTGDRIEGTVVLSLPPTDFAATADNLNHGLFRVGYDRCGGAEPLAFLWVSLWDVPADQVAALKGRLEKALDRAIA